MIISIYDKISLASFRLELPKTVTDLNNLVIMDEQNHAFSLTNMETDDITKKNQLREEFENKEFDKLYQQYPDISKHANDNGYEDQIVLTIMMEIKQNYQELAAMENLQSIARTIASHFVPYAAMRERDKAMSEANEKAKMDENYMCDYAMRIIDMFNSLHLGDPNSVRGFSAKLTEIKRFMEIDSRRHAGYDRLMKGIAEAVNKLSQVFITDNGESKIDLVKAFTDVTHNNEELQKVKDKFNTIMEETKKYFSECIDDLNNAGKLAVIFPGQPELSYLAVLRGLISQYLQSTNAYIEHNTNEKNDEAAKRQVAHDYGVAIGAFMRYTEDVVACYDCYTKNQPADNEYARTIGVIYNTVLSMEDNDKDPAWPYHLAVTLQSQAQEWFKDVPFTQPESENTDGDDQVQKQS